MENQRLTRSERNKMIGGVCAGLAEFFNVDVSMVRIIFVLLAIFGGSGILIYLVLWVILPSQSGSKNNTKEVYQDNIEEIREKAEEVVDKIKVDSNVRRNSMRFIAYILIVLGILLFLDNLGFFRFNIFWPVLLIMLGLVFLGRR